ncbi:MAG: tetratricopeptide repeat protein [Patescibacteria group bacterium]
MPVIISVCLIVFALIVALSIIIKKFPALAILDVTNIPGEKEAKFKEQIIKQRVERDMARWSGWFGRLALFLKRQLSGFLKSRQDQLKKIKTGYKTSLKIPWLEKQKRIKGLFFEADDLLKKDLFDEAEEKLLEIVSLDQKNPEVFFRLGDLYERQKKWSEARQSYEHVLKLARTNNGDKISGDLTRQEIYFSLAGVEKEAENLDASLENARSALDLEPNNPRYLDLILDLSIIRKDKSLAQECWEKLAAVNPENNKLIEWREKIEGLED